MFNLLVEEMAAEFCIPKFKMRLMLLSFKKKLIEAIENGEEFSLSGLMSVRQHKTKGYSRLNPFTGKESVVPERIQTKIVPSKSIKFRPIKDK